MIHVHILPVADDAALSERLLATLTPAEQARIGRLRQPADQRRSITARAALRALLARLLGVAGPNVPLMTAPSGQPIVTGTPWYVSLAHSGERAIVAMACTAVGVDVEADRDMPDAINMARTWFTAAEALHVAKRPADFLPLWTAKEAVLKAAGTGLSGGLSGFTAPMPSTDFLPLSALANSALAGLAVRGLDAGAGYHAALCVQTPAAHALRERRHNLAWLEAVAHTGVAPTESEIFHGQT